MSNKFSKLNFQGLKGLIFFDSEVSTGQGFFILNSASFIEVKKFASATY